VFFGCHHQDWEETSGGVLGRHHQDWDLSIRKSDFRIKIRDQAPAGDMKETLANFFGFYIYCALCTLFI
jgi:hypothetical protein